MTNLPITRTGFLYCSPQQVSDDGLNIGRLYIGFPPDPAQLAQMVDYQVDVLVGAGQGIGPANDIVH